MTASYFGRDKRDPPATALAAAAAVANAMEML